MKYAFISHESAVEALWAIMRNKRFQPLDDEGVWMIPAPESCVTTQRELKQLIQKGCLDELGIRTLPIDLLAPSAASRSRGKMVRFHVWSDFVPEHAFIRVSETVFVSSPLFAILQLTLAPRPSNLSKASAKTASEEDARIRAQLGIEGKPATTEELLAWEAFSRHIRAIQALTDFAGTYRLPAAGEGDTIYDVSPILTCDDLVTFLNSQPSMRGSEKGHLAAKRAFDRSGSPMETALALLLTLPVEMGGYGLPRPELNRQVPISPLERGLVSQDEIIADLFWDDARLAIEYDSWEKHGKLGPAKLAKDHARANSLTALGWKVLTVGFKQVSSAQSTDLLARQAASLLGIELQEPSDLQRIFRSRLHALLLPKVARFS